MHIVIIGCGVSGLSCGIRLLENGYDVTIMARELPPHTTSNVAAAIWYPYKAFPEDKVLKWSAASFQMFLDLVSEPASGISLTTLYEPFTKFVTDPWWAEAVLNFRHAQPDELPDGFVDGYVMQVPIIETPIYMRYLKQRFHKLGGVITQQVVTDLADITAVNPIVVNCAGLGARQLTGDDTLFPIRGQIIRVTVVPDIPAIVDENSHLNLTYIIPRRDGIILGGTAQEDDWRLTVDTDTAVAIREKCLQLEPRLKDSDILEHRVGLRPGRPEVRLEAEQLTEASTIIHNYGHGGAGFTLSWGCAAEVLALVRSVTHSP